MPKGKSLEQLTKNKKPKAIKGLGVTVKLPATPRKKKKDKFPKAKGLPQMPLPTRVGKKPKKKQKLTEEQKKNVEKSATVMEKQDIPGTPHFRMVPKKSASGTKIMEAKGGGLMEATKRLKAQGLKKGGFPDLSGDGKITMKDILMGRGVVKKPKKKAMGGAIKRLPKGAAAGMAGAMKAGARAMKKAGRLALRGYGKARK